MSSHVGPSVLLRRIDKMCLKRLCYCVIYYMTKKVSNRVIITLFFYNSSITFDYSLNAEFFNVAHLKSLCTSLRWLFIEQITDGPPGNIASELQKLYAYYFRQSDLVDSKNFLASSWPRCKNKRCHEQVIHIESSCSWHFIFNYNFTAIWMYSTINANL